MIEPQWWHKYSLYISLILAFVTITLLMRSTHVQRHGIRHLTRARHNRNQWIFQIGFVVVGFVFIQILQDATLPMLVGGYVFGFQRGLLLNVVLTTLSGTASFWKGRSGSANLDTLMQEDHTLSSLLQVEDDLTETEWAELIMLTRINPLFSYHLLSIFWGTTHVSYVNYILSSLAGYLPYLTGITYLGSQMPKPHHLFTHSPFSVTPRKAIILVLSVAITIYTHFFMKDLIHNHRKLQGTPDVRST